MIVDRILDFKMRADEPPAAAQFLCSKLYNEFAFLPEIEDGNMASSMGFAPDVVECAEHLYGVFLVLALHAPPRCTQAMLSFSSLSLSLSLSLPPPLRRFSTFQSPLYADPHSHTFTHRMHVQITTTM
jgi:hypothetical protein